MSEQVDTAKIAWKALVRIAAVAGAVVLGIHGHYVIAVIVLLCAAEG